MKNISTICKAVATMANQLRKLSYSLAEAFRRIKFLKMVQQSDWDVLLHFLI